MAMQTGVVEAVLDGGTFRLNTGETVKLAEVDAPEAGSPGYAQAFEKLKQLIESKVVIYDQRTVDSYGRVVADVWVNSIYVNDRMYRFVSLL
jgi:endonuclease YncB( thermonuclease family)